MQDIIRNFVLQRIRTVRGSEATVKNNSTCSCACSFSISFYAYA